jgi:hypothetical protein
MVSWDGIMATEEGEIKHRRSCSTGFSPPFSLSECWLHFSPWRLPTCDMPNYVFGQINSNTYTYVYYIYSNACNPSPQYRITEKPCFRIGSIQFVARMTGVIFIMLQ